METSYLGEIKHLRTLIKEKQLELHKKENFMESLLMSMDDLVFVLDTEGVFVDAFYNERTEHALYRPKSDFIGKHHNDVLPENTHCMFNDAFYRLIETREPQQYEYYLKGKNGEEWYEARLSVIKNTATDFAGIVAVVRNITSRKAAIDILKQEKTKLELVTENLGAGLLVVGRDFHVLWSNKVIRKRYPGVIGSKCSMFSCNDFVTECPTRRLFEHGTEREESSFREGSEWDKVVTTPITDSTGKVIAALELITFKS